MLDSTTSRFTAQRRVYSKGDYPRLIGRTKGGLNSKLNAVCAGHGRPVLFLLTEGQVSGYKGASILQRLLPDTCTSRQAKVMTRVGCGNL